MDNETVKETINKDARERILRDLTSTMIAYLEDSEQKHYLEYCDDIGVEGCKDHIYLVAMKAKTILENIEEEGT